MARLAVLTLAAVMLAACTRKEANQGPVAGTSTISGQAVLLGLGGVAGTTVQLVGTSLRATSTDGGDFELTSVPDGLYVLHLVNGAFEETVPNVIALPGTHGIHIDGGIFPLDTIELQRARRVAWTPDFLEVYATSRDSRYAVVCEAGNDLFLLDLTTEERVHLAYQCMERALFTPDGAGVLYCVTETGLCTITVAPTAGGPAVSFGEGSIAAVSPDGWSVAMVDGPSLAVISLVDLTKHVVATDVQRMWAMFSPDSSLLAFGASSNEVAGMYVAPVTGGPAVHLADADPGVRAFTPDGGTLAFGTGGVIRGVSTSGGSAATISAEGGYCFAVSPDGTRIVYEGYARGVVQEPRPPLSVRSLWSVPVDGGTPVVLDSAMESSCPPRFAPGSRRVIYSKFNNAMVVDMAGGQPLWLPTQAVPVVNHAGTHALYPRDGDGHLELARLSDGAPVWNVPWDSSRRLIEFSPDDATISLSDVGLDVISTATGMTIPLLSTCENSMWTPGGTLIGMTSGQGPPRSYRGGLYVAHLP